MLWCSQYAIVVLAFRGFLVYRRDPSQAQHCVHARTHRRSQEELCRQPVYHIWLRHGDESNRSILHRLPMQSCLVSYTVFFSKFNTDSLQVQPGVSA